MDWVHLSMPLFCFLELFYLTHYSVSLNLDFKAVILCYWLIAGYYVIGQTSTVLFFNKNLWINHGVYISYNPIELSKMQSIGFYRNYLNEF